MNISAFRPGSLINNHRQPSLVRGGAIAILLAQRSLRKQVRLVTPLALGLRHSLLWVTQLTIVLVVYGMPQAIVEVLRLFLPRWGYVTYLSDAP